MHVVVVCGGVCVCSVWLCARVKKCQQGQCAPTTGRPPPTEGGAPTGALRTPTNRQSKAMSFAMMDEHPPNAAG